MNQYMFVVLSILISSLGIYTQTAAADESLIKMPQALVAHPNEHMPGGTTSHTKKINANAFSQPSANMSFEHQMDFLVGNGFFKRLWVSAPASTHASDGLGPLFNARSCQGCHLKDGRGHAPIDANDQRVSMLLRLSVPPRNEIERQSLAAGKQHFIAEPTYGGQLQDLAIVGHQAEGHIDINYTTQKVYLADDKIVELRQPTYSISQLGYGKLDPKTMISPRVAPQMIGLGLLELIPEAKIRQQADPDDRDNDGISGKPNEFYSDSEQKMVLGRFGLKAGAATVKQQVQDAFFGDMSLSSPLHPNAAGECTASQKKCLAAPNGNSPDRANPENPDFEVGEQVVDLVTFYSRNLSVPMRRNVSDPQVLQGQYIFNAIGCSGCHTPSYTTEQSEQLIEQSGQLIWPYTDMLLHDMGAGLADNRPEAKANGQEWRTAPLWGLGTTKTVSQHTEFLHDGRARNISEAIVWHGGEAESSKLSFTQLSTKERESLLAFLNSL